MGNLEPIIKWPGGKERELKYIIPSLPSFVDYYEPFVGGGSVFTAMEASKYYINDKSVELISLYLHIKNKNNSFFEWCDKINKSWISISNISFLRKFCDYYLENRSNHEICNSKNYIQNILNSSTKEISDLVDDFPSNNNALYNELVKNIQRKIKRMFVLESKLGLLSKNDIEYNIESAIKGSLYMFFRNIYNIEYCIHKTDDLHIALFLFLRNFSYSGMFRYNKRGDFNVPYGGIAYNKNSLSKKLSYYKSDKLENLMSKTSISNYDFYDFFKKYTPKSDDFIFLDPPYDSDFCTYSNNEFTKHDQMRLANYLKKECSAKWLMIIKETPLILSLYANNKSLNIERFSKKYSVSFMNRNEKCTNHLLITNYKI